MEYIQSVTSWKGSLGHNGCKMLFYILSSTKRLIMKKQNSIYAHWGIWFDMHARDFKFGSKFKFEFSSVYFHRCFKYFHAFVSLDFIPQISYMLWHLCIFASTWKTFPIYLHFLPFFTQKTLRFQYLCIFFLALPI